MSPFPLRRLFSTSSLLQKSQGSTNPIPSKALVFAKHGDPKEVLKCFNYTLPGLKIGEVRVEVGLSAVNPADGNVIQGVYPSKPPMRDDLGSSESLCIMGNEAFGIITGIEEDGKVEKVLKLGDSVIMGKAQLGTWQTHMNLPLSSLIPLKCNPPLNPIQASTLSINPPTAFRMLTDFITLNPSSSSSSSSLSEKEKGKGKGEEGRRQQWVIQNGGNSAVGIAVIQLCKLWGVKTINLVRDREDITTLKSNLKKLGADQVLTYPEFFNRETRTELKELIKGPLGTGQLRLGLNCVGGKETTEMAKLLHLDGVLVTYGGMAKQSLSIPPSLFIFKKLTSTGFWLSNWNKEHPLEKIEMINTLAQLTAEGKLIPVDTEIIELKKEESDELVGEQIRKVMGKMEEGRGKKILFKWV